MLLVMKFGDGRLRICCMQLDAQISCLVLFLIHLTVHKLFGWSTLYNMLNTIVAQSQCNTWEHDTACQLCLFWLVHIVQYMQVATELVVGFPKSFINKEMLARQKQLWGDWLDGFLALPINLPGFGMQSYIMPAWMCACAHCVSTCMHA